MEENEYTRLRTGAAHHTLISGEGSRSVWTALFSFSAEKLCMALVFCKESFVQEEKKGGKRK